ncbi:hypothetical protein [Nostoc sp.]
MKTKQLAQYASTAHTESYSSVFSDLLFTANYRSQNAYRINH